MEQKPTIKIALIATLTVLLLIPLMLVESKISERSRYRTQAKASIAQSWTGAQLLAGPILVIPYCKRSEETIRDAHTGVTSIKTRQTTLYKYILPEDLSIDGRLDTQLRTRGIYKVPVYTAELNIAGHFSGDRLAEQRAELGSRGDIVRVDEPYLAIHIQDIRGFTTVGALKWNDVEQPFEAGSGLETLGSGLHVPLSSSLDSPENVATLAVRNPEK